MKKNLLVFPALFLSLLSYADNENYSNQDVSGQDFSNLSLKKSKWSFANATGTIFQDSNLTDASFYSATLTDAYFYSATLTNANLSQADLTDAYFDSATLTNANLSQADLTDAYLSQANLTDASFYSATLTGADLRGAKNFVSTSGTLMKNTILINGVIKDFSMESESDSFAVRKYIPVQGGEQISAVIEESASILNGAVLTIENGEVLHISNEAVLTLGDGGVLVLEASQNSNSSILVEEGAGLAFSDISQIIINLTEEVPTPQTFAAINWTDIDKISGTENLIKNQTVFVNLNDASFEGWSLSVTESGLYISVPEPSAYAAIFGALAVAFALYRRRK